MNSESGKVVENFFDAFGRGDLEALYGLFDPGVVIELTGPKTVPWYGTRHGLDGVKQMINTLGAEVNTQAFSVDSVIGGEGEAFAKGSFTHIVKATGKKFESDWALFCKERAGKITHYQFFENTSAADSAFQK